jgi:hypothetical protein
VQTVTTKDTVAEIETHTGIETETGTEIETETVQDNVLDLAHPADIRLHHSSDRSGLSLHRTTRSKAKMAMRARQHQP